MLSKSALWLLFAAVLAPAGAALAQSTTPRPAPPMLAAGFDVHGGTLQVLQPQVAGNGDVAVPIQLGPTLLTMALQPHDLRAPTFQLLVEDATGIHQVPTPPCTTYRGILLEEPTTSVAASIVGTSVSAIVYRPAAQPGEPGENWVVQPAREVDPTAGPNLHIVYRAKDTVPLPYKCGNASVAQQPPLAGVDTTFECDIAIEADVEFYQQNGSNVVATQNDITSVMNQVEFIYNRDCDIQYALTTILVTTTAVYSTDDPNLLLNQYATRWNSTFPGIVRDVAHLFTGRNLTGSTIGIAALSSICNLGQAYGLSQSRFTTNFNSRVGLTSHEIGHGWSAQHCDGINPCYIMCAGLGGCSGNVTLFSPFEIGQITGFAATRPCLSVVPTTPVISTATPNQVTVFQPGNVNLSGSGFTGATSFRVGTQMFTTGFTVSNDNVMTITMPPGTVTGATTLAVTTPQGTSNSLPMLYTLTSPPKLKATLSVPATGGIANFDFAGTPGRQWFLMLGLTNTTSPFQGLPLLNPSLLLTNGSFAGPIGVSHLSVPVPGGLGLLILYLQILEADALLPVATGTSSVVTTVLL